MATSLAATALVLFAMVPIPGLPVPTEPEPPEYQVSGSTAASDGTLRRGCRPYRYSYTVSTPHHDWTLETSVLDRRGKSVHAGVLFGSSAAKTGEQVYEMCRWATTPGAFTITGRLISYDGERRTEAQLAESRFVLRLRRR